MSAEIEHTLEGKAPGEMAQILDLVSDPILILDEELKILHINPPAQHFFGASTETYGLKCEDVLGGKGYGRTIAKLCKGAMVKGGALTTRLSAVSTGKQSLRWNIKAMPMGKSAVLVTLSLEGLAQQTKGFVRMDGATSSEEFRVLLDLLPDVVFEVDDQGKILYANGMALELTGHEPEILDRLRLDQFLRAVDGSNINMVIKKLMEGELFHRNRRYQLLTADGKEIPVEVNALTIHGPDQRPRVLGIARDHTRRLMLEEQLRRSEERYRELFDSSRDLIFTVDSGGYVLEINRTIVGLRGCPRHSLIGKPFADMLLLEHRSSFTTCLQSTLAGRIEVMEADMRDSDGRIHTFELVLSPLLSSGAVVEVHGSARDITESRQMQRQIQQLQKMDSLGRLAAGVAHDFNNVLGAVIGFASVLERELMPDHLGLDDVQKIVKAARQGAELTRNILSFARGGVRKDEILDLSALIQEVAQVLVGGMGPRMEIVLEGTENPCLVKADSGQIRQVLMNLCVNSREAMPHGGVIRVRLSQKERWPSSLGPAPLNGPYVEVAVIDQGPGIPKSAQHRIFEPFFTTKSHEERLGLGLSICWGIARDHGGIIDVESEMGKGATFRLLLPATTSSLVIPPPVPQAKPETRTGQALVVDDQPAMLHAARRMLEIAGYSVVCAQGWTEAKRQIEVLPGGFDLALVDLSMPDVDGVAVCRQLLDLYPNLPIIAVSGYSAEGAARKVLDEGARAFLQKPFSLEQLLATIGRITT